MAHSHSSTYPTMDRLREHAGTRLTAAEHAFERARDSVQRSPEDGEARQQYIRAGMELDYATQLAAELSDRVDPLAELD